MESGGTREQQPWRYSCSFAWPPRSYTCSFCKREFRSAQALGGHMNVHRRDRARLRHGSPPPPPPPPPQLAAAAAGSPNPRRAAAAAIPNLNYPPPPPPPPQPSLYIEGSSVAAANTGELGLSLELGLEAGVQSCTKEEDDGLDLELRLGCS